MNNVALIGRLVQNPTKASTTKGTIYCRFTIAIDRTYGEDKKTDFIDCTAFNKTSENILKYVSKGNLIAVNGRLQSSSYYDDRAQKNIYSVGVIADSVQFLERKKENNTLPNQYINPNTPGYQTIKQDEIVINEDDLPF